MKNTPKSKTRIETLGLDDRDDESSWVCICGNRSSTYGFFPVGEYGPVESTPEEWTTNEYVCDRCGRVIDQETRRVARRLSLSTSD